MPRLAKLLAAFTLALSLAAAVRGEDVKPATLLPADKTEDQPVAVTLCNAQSRSKKRSIVAELLTKLAGDLTQLPAGLARESPAGAIFLAYTLFVVRDHQAGTYRDGRHLVVGRTLLQRFGDAF